MSAIRVTVADPDNGDTETASIENDHIIVCAGTAYIASVTAYSNRTQVVTIKHAATPEEAAQQQTKITRHFGKAALS